MENSQNEKKAIASNSELSLGEERFRTFLSNLEDIAVQAYEPDGTITFWNRGSENFYGYKESEALGKDILELLFGPGTREQERQIMSEAVRKQKLYTSDELEIYRKDGRMITILAIRCLHLRFGKEPEFFCFGIDIAGLKKAESQFNVIVKNSPVGILVVDHEGKHFLQANQAICRMLGYSEAELLKKGIEDIHPVDALPNVKFFFEALKSGEITSAAALPCLRKDGAIIYADISASPIVIGGKKAVSCFFVDVTESKMAGEKIRESEETYRNLFQNAQVGLFRTRISDGKLLESNEQLAKMFGYDNREEFIAEYITSPNYVDPGTRERMLDMIKKDGFIKNFEARFYRKDRSIFWARYSAKVYPEKGWIEGVVEDITEYKLAEQALRESEGKYRELFDQAPIGYHELDRNGIIVRVNETELEMLGYKQEEMIGKYICKFIAGGEIKELFYGKIAGQIPPGKTYERQYIKKDGTLLPVLVEDRILKDKDGNITGIRTTIQDISELKRVEKEKEALEAQLRQAQKMEAIGKLAGGIAHDFNNILTAISGYCALSLLGLKKEDPLRSYLEEIDKASNRAADLTSRLLAFSRKQIQDIRVLDLNYVLRELHGMLIRLLREDIDLTIIEGESLGKIKTDQSQIEQVIINLATNARDAMPNGGKLIIETANVELDEEYASKHLDIKPGQYVALSVSDTGAGMTEDVRERIFEPFFTTKGLGDGTGLGLATVYGIVKQSGGNIWVYSEVGKGTTFKIYFPQAAEPLDELKKKEITGEILHGNETILVVEDEDAVREVAVTALEMHGYKVLSASRGEDALLISEKYKDPIHMILTDVIMPGMSGKALVERLKKIHPEMKALYMSGYTNNVIAHHGVLQAGVNFIQKPFIFQKLAKKVREVLDSR